MTDTPTFFRHGRRPCTGILLANLGTPEAPTAPALRRYLAQFLSDPRVVEVPRLVWLPVLHGIILRTRPAKSAKKYRQVWTPEGSPLLTISRRQGAGLQERLDKRVLGLVRVAVGMRYGEPSIPGALEELRRQGAERILLLPLYPQYSASTTASSFDALAATLGGWRWLPELRVVNGYHDHPPYIRTLADSVRSAWQLGQPGQRLLFSFHGLPKRNLLAGDPYHCQCHKTARLVAQSLDLPDERWAVSFQSRFGPAEWLKPYTDETLGEWARQGLKAVDVICPGFSADCLETLEEIAQENRDIFLQAGGEAYRYIPALNDRPQHLDMLADLVVAHCQGWPEFDPHRDRKEEARQRQRGRERALAMGAEQ
ncbi:MAG: ferrochelatase [Candidatus Competibacteraceae bacterium]|nr:ferrochelatase [Candidatus Competibacteraceae bacterium]